MSAQVPPWPTGFAATTAHGGIRDSGDDISVIHSVRPAVSAAVFTRSLFAGPAIVVNRRHAHRQDTRAVVTLAQNANVATGREGEAHAEEVVGRIAAITGVEPAQVLIGSTGVIGRKLPMDAIRSALDGVAARTASASASASGSTSASASAEVFDADPVRVATAMMTTDTHPKTATATVPTADGGTARITGVAKGVGMLEPNMATMLAYLTTDAELTPDEADGALRSAVDRTFNCLSVDTDTSTSDTVCLLANGAAGPVDPEQFTDALHRLCLDLTRQLARDGEGADKLITVTVTGALDDAQAKRVAKSVVNSPLVKTAVHGADPNWGRVVMAVGKLVDEPGIHPDRTTVAFGGLEVYPAEVPEARLGELAAVMSREEVPISIGLGTGPGCATVYGCDLTAGYVRINAEYTT